MNWGDSRMPCAGRVAEVKASPREDPLRRKVMSALASLVDKHRRVLEEHDQVVITIHLDWRKGNVKETVMGLAGPRHGLQVEERKPWGSPGP